jgi:HSP20 family protein
MDYIKIRFVDNQESPENEFVRTLEEMMHAARPGFSSSRRRWRPPIDIYETGEEIVVIAEIAGIREEGMDLEIASLSLKLSGYREVRLAKTDASYHLAEISFGYFERTVSLPSAVDAATAEVSYNNGLLEIRLKKRPPHTVRKISIQSA